MVLKVRMERSSVVIGSISIEKPKRKLLQMFCCSTVKKLQSGLDCESRSNSPQRNPLLRDLPWWFLGLRYIFGYDQETVSQKEIILLIKADILPSLKENV